MRKKLTYAIMLAVVGMSIIANLNADKGKENMTIGYQFPLKPGMEEWAELKNVHEKYVATQIPVEILEKMPTEELVETCLTYPLLVNIFLFNSQEEGFDQLRKNFNGFQELLTRDDAGKKLMKRYYSYDPIEMHERIQKKSSNVSILSAVVLEIFLSQEKIIQNLSSKEKYQLAEIALEKFETKQQYPETYGYLSLSPNGAVMKNVLESEGFFNLSASQKVDSSYSGVDLPNVAEIIEQTKKFLIEKRGGK